AQLQVAHSRRILCSRVRIHPGRDPVAAEAKSVPREISRTALQREKEQRSAQPSAMRENRQVVPHSLSAAAWSLQAGLGHLAEVEHLVERGLRHTPPARELADRAAGADGLLGYLC